MNLDDFTTKIEEYIDLKNNKGVKELYENLMKTNSGRMIYKEVDDRTKRVVEGILIEEPKIDERREDNSRRIWRDKRRRHKGPGPNRNFRIRNT